MLIGFWRGKKDQDFKVFANVVEFVRHLSRYKNQAAWLHGLGFIAHGNLPLPADYVINLVLVVWLLWVHATGRQGVNYARNVWHHPLLVLDENSLFLVVDRTGPGNNLDEYELSAAERLSLAP